MEELIAEQQQVDDPDSEERDEIFAEIQEIAVDEALIVPLIEETPVVFARDGVSGLEETMDVMQIFRYWLVSAD
jgi:peptide/nickel transport system substrate-binding protein